MKQLLSILVLAVIAFSSFESKAAFRADMKGATQAEREIRWLWKYAGEFVGSCARSQTECVDPEINKVVLELNGYIPAWDSAQAPQWSTLLQFISEKNNPGVFSSAQGEAHRVMVTQAQKMSAVLVNTDRMTMKLEDQLGLLIHEAVHHLGYGDDASRLPDRVGAEIAKHFLKQMKRSTLEQFNRPEYQIVTVDTMLPNRANVGLISWGDWTSDVDWSSGLMQPLCDNKTEIMNRQEISAPTFRVQSFKESRGIVTVKGGGTVKVVCLNPKTGAFHTNRFALDARFQLQYPLPFDREKWMDQTPTTFRESVYLAPSWNENDNLWGLAQTFSILSTEHDKKVVKAGETMRTTMRLKSIDGFQPDACQLFIAGTQYALNTQDTVPGVSFYQSCRVTALAGGEWQVEGDVRFPTNAREDSYYVPLVILQSRTQGDRDAIPLFPMMVKLENPTAPPAPIVRSLEIKGLPAATMFLQNSVTNSFLAQAGQEFQVEFVVEGKVLATNDLWLDVGFHAPPLNGGTETVWFEGAGSSSSLPALLLSTDVTYVPNGTLISMKWKMPATLAGAKILAMKFKRFYVRTYDFSWAEIETPVMFDSMVIDPAYGK